MTDSSDILHTILARIQALEDGQRAILAAVTGQRTSAIGHRHVRIAALLTAQSLGLSDIVAATRYPRQDVVSIMRDLVSTGVATARIGPRGGQRYVKGPASISVPTSVEAAPQPQASQDPLPTIPMWLQERLRTTRDLPVLRKSDIEQFNATMTTWCDLLTAPDSTPEDDVIEIPTHDLDAMHRLASHMHNWWISHSRLV